MEPLDRLVRLGEEILSWSSLGVLGAFGGVANFYYLNATKNRAFAWGLLAANVVVAFFIGRVVGGFIDPDNQFRDSIAMLLGFFSFPVVHILEARLVAIINRVLPFGGE